MCCSTLLPQPCELAALEDSKGVGYHSVIPEAPGAESHPLTKTFGETVGDYVQQYLEAMEKVTDTLPTYIFCCCFNLPLIPRILFAICLHDNFASVCIR